MRTWEALADGLIDAAILARLEATWPGRGEGQRSQAWIERQLSRVDSALAAMSTGLGENPGARASTFRWPTSRSAARSATSTSASR